MRTFALLSCCALFLGLAACESDEQSPMGGPCTTDDDCARGQVCSDGTCAADSDTGTDTGNPPLDTGIDVPSDTTDAGDVCEYACVRTADCADAGFTNGQCISGCCEEGTVGPRCEVHLAPCSASSADTDEFVCDTDLGQCLQRCNSETADDTESADCPLNSYCLGDDGSGTELNGVCYPGDCDSNIFDPEACDGVGTCYPVGNGASYCIEAGTAGVDDPCNQEIADDNSQPARDICGPGLLCLRGTCVEPCNLRESTGECDGGLECVRAFDITQRNQPGVCGVECDAFSGGQCGEGEVCDLVTGRFGINAWMCTPVGDLTVIEEVGAACGDDGTRCAEGLICLGGDDAVCTPICDPTSDTSNEFSACATEGDICVPSALNGFGFCLEECTPYPRREGEYDCEGSGDMCIPFTTTDEEPVEPSGFCDVAEGDVAAWDECDNTDSVIGDCADYALCLNTTEDDTDPAICFPICEPLGDSGCPDGATCSGVYPLVGILSLSLCTQDPQPGDIGDRCTEDGLGLPCTADHSICLDLGAGPECARVCREGFDDCADVTGTDCEVGGFNPEVVPEYMGVCI